MSNIYDFAARTLAGEDVSLADFRGKVLLIVNTASQCGFTPQYGDATEIANFCKLTYDVSFPMFAKIDVNGPSASPLYEWLKNEAPGVLGSKAIKWNFTKFLVNRDGQVVGRFAPTTKPEALRADIEALL